MKGSMLSIEERELLSTAEGLQTQTRKKYGLIALVGIVMVLSIVVLSTYGAMTSGVDTKDLEDQALAHLYQMEHQPYAQCNDGTQAVFYMRKSLTGSKKWFVYYDGGNACYSNATCMNRWETDQEHMTAHTEESMTFEDHFGQDSILSADAEVNPYWWDYNAVYVQYCSSDSFIGNISKEDVEYYTPWHFRGAEIARGAFRELVGYHGMDEAEQVILGSVSAGSFGAMAHGNYAMDYLAEHAPQAEFKVWLDSGFWLLNEPWRASYAPKNCSTLDWVDCHIDGCHELSFEHFNTVQNEECRAETDYTWECAFPEVNLPYLRFPMLVTQQQYDKLQLQGAGIPIAKQLVNEGLEMTMERGEMWREELQAASHVWSSNCRKHDIIDKEPVFSIIIENESTDYKPMTANEASHVWMEGDAVWFFDDVYEPDENPTCPEF